MSLFARLVSSRVRHLEQELARVSADYEALSHGEFDKMSVTQMSFTPERGLEAHFEGNIAKVLAGWAFNCLKCSNAENYIEFQVRHPDAGAISVTIQKTRGETPAAKANRFESALKEIVTQAENGRWTLPSSFAARARTALPAAWAPTIFPQDKVAP